VTFTLNAGAGIPGSGTSSLGTPGVLGSITSLTNGLEVAYTYSYDDSPSQVPEPATMFLAGFGLLGLAFSRTDRAR
jgi:hypothetical protein